MLGGAGLWAEVAFPQPPPAAWVPSRDRAGAGAAWPAPRSHRLVRAGDEFLHLLKKKKKSNKKTPQQTNTKPPNLHASKAASTESTYRRLQQRAAKPSTAGSTEPPVSPQQPEPQDGGQGTWGPDEVSPVTGSRTEMSPPYESPGDSSHPGCERLADRRGGSLGVQPRGGAARGREGTTGCLSRD